MSVGGGRLALLLGFLEQDPANLPLLQDAADCALQEGQWAQARALVERALVLAPQDPASRFRLATICTHEGDCAAGLALTQALLDEGQCQDAVLFQHALALILANRHGEAEPILAALQPRAASLPGFDHLYVRALHAAGKLDQAIQVAIALGEDPIAQGMLSLLHVDHDQLEPGRALAQSVLAAHPHNIDALLAAGTAGLALEQHGLALSVFERAASVHPGNGRAWMGIGLTRLSAADYAGARQALEKAVRLLPSHLGTWNALAWVQLMQDDLPAAEATLSSALAADRNFGETHGSLAVLKTMQQDWDAAGREAAIALRLQPESFAGRFAQSLLLEHRSQPAQARALLLQVMQGFPAPAGGNLIDVVRRHAARQGRQPFHPPSIRKEKQ